MATIKYPFKMYGPIPYFTEMLDDDFKVDGIRLIFTCPSAKCHWFEEGNEGKCKWNLQHGYGGCNNPVAISNAAIRAEDMLMTIRDRMEDA